jgi:uncharacterized protein (DUF58 family)
MLALATEKLRLHVATWARRRQGTDPKSIVLKRRRVFILPSRFGLIFAILVFAMVLGAMNYASSLGFALAFLLTGLGIVSMHHCHRNLLGTAVRFSGVQPVFAGEDCEYRLALTNNARATRYEISLHHNAYQSHAQDLEPRESKSIILKIPTQTRGRAQLGRCSVTTRFPGNLFRAWSWIHMDAECIVYPNPIAQSRPLPMSSGGDGSHGVAERGDADFAGLKTADPADPPQRIAWKASARSEELLAKQFAGGEQRAQILAWDQLHGLETEERLSQLTRWCVDAAAEECTFGLDLPGTAIPLGRGQRHLHDCLKALALFDGSGER